MKNYLRQIKIKIHILLITLDYLPEHNIYIHSHRSHPRLNCKAKYQYHIKLVVSNSIYLIDITGKIKKHINFGIKSVQFDFEFEFERLYNVTNMW